MSLGVCINPAWFSADELYIFSLNQSLINVLKHADKVAICGEAISHCVNYTVRDLVDAWPKERLSDLIILADCASPVPGFEAAGEVRAFFFTCAPRQTHAKDLRGCVRSGFLEGHGCEGHHIDDVQGVQVVSS